MVFYNRDTNETRHFILPMTLFYILGPFYLLYQLMAWPGIKWLFIEVFTLGCHRFVSPFFIGRILQAGMHGNWVLIEGPSIIDHFLPCLMVCVGIVLPLIIVIVT